MIDVGTAVKIAKGEHFARSGILIKVEHDLATIKLDISIKKPHKTITELTVPYPHIRVADEPVQWPI